ncbi:hypothetical protein RX717_11150 [Intestinibacillus sp. NTUH-41-i26]|uniref:hypothetical protein n=1 Tax=Butyricicoccaceae TaxID=3085642 RepID=UPI000D1D6D02|nr:MULTISPECIES: hypothetical protein [Butyricicoccaceae]WOC74550.1 hypothetical protein RX717_11150 [Intestinibacillus sp. NTUH-41-i26]
MRKIFREECNAALQNVTFDNRQQKAVRMRVERCHKPRRRMRGMVAVAVAAALTFSGAFAVQAVRDNIRNTMASWEDTHTGTALGLSQSDAGLTVTLDEIYGDTWYVYLKGTVASETEKTMRVDNWTNRSGTQYANAGFCDWEFTIPDQKTQLSHGSNISFLSVNGQEDAPLEFLIRLSATDFALTGEASALFNGFWYEADGELQELDGCWEFTFPVDRNDDGETLLVGKSIQTDAGTVTLDCLQFSALDISAEWSGANEALFGWDQSNTYLLLKSGERIGCQSAGIEDENGEKTRMEFAPFNNGLGHISADDVQAVVFAGQEIPVT